jgi:hypothetical protein
MKYRMIQRCRDAFPIRLMCRCLRVSSSGYYGWVTRPPSARAQANARLLERIRALHADHDGIVGSPRIWEDLRYAGERCGRHRVARLMRRAGLQGVPQRRRWRTKPCRARPQGTRNHLERNFTATAQYQMGHRYHLHSDGRAVVVSLCRAGFVFGARGGLVDEPTPGPPVGGPSGTDGVMAAARPCPSHSAFGSGLSIYLRRVPTVSGGSPHHL